MRSVSCLLFICLITTSLHAALIKGRVTNSQGEGLSFATVFIKGTSTGTSCNDEGFYEIKVSAGVYTLGFQYIGYKTALAEVTADENQAKQLNIQLAEEEFTLGEVKVNATAEDPAYPIMRQAIAMRRTYLVEAKEYQCRVYLKGMQRLTKVPKRVMLVKVPDDIKPGIIYLSESLSELSFRLPDKVKERMISSKVSGNNRAFSFNRAGAIKFNLYEPLINSFGLSERGFVSPLSSTAFMFYKFKLEGESRESGQTIFKIRLIPQRNNDPVFRGHIYIVKDSWRLQSTDLLVNKAAGVEFVDTLYIKQQYAAQQGGVWMPVSQRFIFQFEAFGFKGNGYFVASYSGYKVNSSYGSGFYAEEETKIKSNEVVPQVRKVAKVKPPKKVVADSSLFTGKYFNREVMSIDKKANKTEDALWDSIRPVPLTEEEMLDYRHKDSAQAITESKPYLDSTDRISNRFRPGGFLLTGYTYANSFQKKYYTFDPPLTIIQYNTVEGLVLNPRLRITREHENNTHWFITPQARYGFASERAYGRASAGYYFNPVKESQVSIEGGNFVEQFNRNEPISPFINTFYTLLVKRNYLKIYEKAYVNVKYSSEIINGVRLTASAEYAHRSTLVNHSGYSWSSVPVSFIPNQPFNAEVASTAFPAHRALVAEVETRIVFAQRYISRPDDKINFRSPYPVLNLSYRKGIAVDRTAADFDEVGLSARQGIDLGLFGDSYWRLFTGIFLNKKRVYFMDYHHFGGNRTIFSLRGFSGFQLLDYYAYSTSDKYLQAQYSHHFNGFIFNKIPLFRRLKWQEVVTVNYLKTPVSSQYIELGFGIEHIFKFLRADYFVSFASGTYQSQGIRVGFGY